MAHRTLGAVFCLLAHLSVSGQTNEISGRVVDEQGVPISGVSIYSNLSCCPPRSAHFISGLKGQFRLEPPGSVLHFEHDGFQPLAVVLRDGKEDLEIKLLRETEKFLLSKCKDAVRGEQLLGMRGVRFLVPKRGVRVSRVEDVDYVVYGIRVKRKGATLELWFGPTAFSPEPDDKLLISSSEFSQKNFYGPEGKFMGLDSRGRTPAERLWRHSGGVGQGAKYSDALPEEAAIFDRIIDSRCVSDER